MYLMNKFQELKHRHNVPAEPITAEEVQAALSHARPNTSSGHDSVCYTAVRAFFEKDTSGKLVKFFNSILCGDIPVPPDWTRGKLSFLPKCPRPCRPQDPRPISLTLV